MPNNNDGNNMMGGDNTITLNIAGNCYHLLGGDDCRSAAAVGTRVGTVMVEGATAYSITMQSTADRYAIDNNGVVTVAAAFAPAANLADTLTVEATIGEKTETRQVTINNDAATAVMESVPFVGNELQMNSDANGLTLDAVTSGEDNRCTTEAPCLSGVYTGAWGGWYFGLPMDITSIDLSDYTNVVFSYKVTSGSTSFEFKQESAGVDNGQYLLDGMNTRIGITADDTWQEATIPLSALMGLKDGSGGAFAGGNDDDANGLQINALTVPLGFWNWGTNAILIIDEVYAK